MRPPRLLLPAILGLLPAVAAFSPAAGDERSAFFGDLHVHTAYSFDAFSFATRTTADDAYRFAAGEAILHPSGNEIQLDRPLDFYAVTDHAAYLGVLRALADPGHPLAGDPEVERYVDPTTVKARGGYLPGASDFVAGHADPEVVRSAWQEIVDAAERHYRPGTLTTFIAYEYTPSRDGGNLHRNVIFRGGTAPREPFSRLDSPNPEDLWSWMDRLRDQGIEALAIPHNSNGSDGWMFQTETFAGGPLDAAYATKRMRNEPLVEITQVKGTSETHPVLSPNDEWADFEIFPFRVGQWARSRPRGSYVRQALLDGIAFQSREGFNPYRLGFVGASDTHNSGFVFDEEKHTGKVGVHDFDPVSRGSVPVDIVDGVPTYREVFRRFYSNSGLTGVWAEENSREAIYGALRRKETFATSGTRIRLRTFAGYGLPDDLHLRDDMATVGYERGVAMGGELDADRAGSPVFAVRALRDPSGAPLQRLQIVKGWVQDGDRHEQVFDVACSDGLEPDPATQRCPDNGASVDLSDCAISQDVGDAELGATWSDPGFDPGQYAFYYVRVLENPTCRWSTWDAVKAGVAPRVSLPATIQERAWSSPIWIVPGR